MEDSPNFDDSMGSYTSPVASPTFGKRRRLTASTSTGTAALPVSMTMPSSSAADTAAAGVFTFDLPNMTDLTSMIATNKAILDNILLNQNKIMASLERLQNDVRIQGNKITDMNHQRFDIKKSNVYHPMMAFIRRQYLKRRISFDTLDVEVVDEMKTIAASCNEVSVSEAQLVELISRQLDRSCKNWRNEELKKFRSSNKPIAEVVERMLSSMTTPVGDKGELRPILFKQMVLARYYYNKRWVKKTNATTDIDGNSVGPPPGTKPGFWFQFYLWRVNNNYTEGKMADKHWERVIQEEENLRLEKIK